jgi:hypothetical protein
VSCVPVLRSWMHSATPPSSACFRYTCTRYTTQDAGMMLCCSSGGAPDFYSGGCSSYSDSATASHSAWRSWQVVRPHGALANPKEPDSDQGTSPILYHQKDRKLKPPPSYEQHRKGGRGNWPRLAQTPPRRRALAIRDFEQGSFVRALATFLKRSCSPGGRLGLSSNDRACGCVWLQQRYQLSSGYQWVWVSGRRFPAALDRV